MLMYSNSWKIQKVVGKILRRKTSFDTKTLFLVEKKGGLAFKSK